MIVDVRGNLEDATPFVIEPPPKEVVDYVDDPDGPDFNTPSLIEWCESALSRPVAHAVGTVRTSEWTLELVETRRGGVTVKKSTRSGGSGPPCIYLTIWVRREKGPLEGIDTFLYINFSDPVPRIDGATDAEDFGDGLGHRLV